MRLYKRDITAKNLIVYQGYIIQNFIDDEYFLAIDCNHPSEFIYLPKESVEKTCSLMVCTGRTLLVPDSEDNVHPKHCKIWANAEVLAIGLDDLTWVGNEDNGCWAYFR